LIKVAGAGPEEEAHAAFTNAEIPIIDAGYYQDGWDRGYLPDPFEEPSTKPPAFNIEGGIHMKYLEIKECMA